MAQATVSQHLANLRRLCRICGRKTLSRANQTEGISALKCYKYVADIKSTFDIDVLEDNELQHPSTFCESCRKKLSNKNRNYLGTAYVWPLHSENCVVCYNCDSMRKGGRPRKVKYGGRPKSSTNVMSESVGMEVEEQLNLPATPPPSCVQLTGIPGAPQMCCATPTPSSAAALPSSAAALPSSAAALPSSSAALPSSTAALHAAESRFSIEELIKEVSKPGQLRHWEKRLFTPLVRRQLPGPIKATTGGQPITLVRVTNARKKTTEASESTVRRRRAEISVARACTSGNEEQAQLVQELQAVSREELAKTLDDLQLDRIRIPTGHLLAAQVDLGLTWNQTRNLKRWLSDHQVVTESEKHSRKIAAEMLGKQGVQAELIPLVVKKKGDNKVVELRPCAQVSNLRVAVHDTIDRLAEAGRLTWYEGQIPEDEIWVKVLGDHGGDLYKMGYQVLNQLNPNATTAVFCAFKAKDSRENLTAATKVLCTEVGELDGTMWTSPDGSAKRMRIFVAGDYAILSGWYGISGPCGTYPCVLCEVLKADMRKPVEEQGTPAKRTLASLADHHRSFQQEGSAIRKAKDHKNVIAPYILPVRIDQVCIPELHISLGLFNKYFSQLEREVRDLDVIIGSHLCRVTLADPDVDRAEVLLHPDLHTLTSYIESIEELREVDEEVEQLEEEMLEIEDNMAWAMVQGQEDCLNVLAMQLKYQRLYKQREDLKSKAQEIKDSGRLGVSEGPLSCQLEPVLKKFNAERQAYQSMAFVGNHVNKLLKDAPIKCLASVAVEKIEEFLEQDIDIPLILYTRAKGVRSKYEQLFTLFGDCHRQYSHARPVSEDEVSALDHSIKALMAFYRASFPQGTVPIKMHLLEVHAVPWMRQWGFGLGFFGEQGIESTHAQFNAIQKATCGIRDESQRLKATMERHLLKLCPSREGGVRAPTPRKT
ncbi:uncharacterized protein LOC144887476 [Branchiostoma floridae x Branchiostoma japonicum]